VEAFLKPRCIEVYDHVESTMDVEPPQLPGVVIALTQLRGRGRSGRWVSPRGGAWLTFSVSRRSPGSWLPVAVGGCVAEEVERLLQRERYKPIIRVKWPNDLYIDRGKLGGILVVYKNGVLRIGVGINVYNAIPPGGAKLSNYGYKKPLADVYLAIIKGIGRALASPEDCLWEASRRDMLRGCKVVVSTEKGILEGVALGLTPSGALLVETKNGVSRVECCGIISWDCTEDGKARNSTPNLNNTSL
jgi:BirA family biotin operon repressor/biotin-[acetyl-CoA-carboxylase] ligase